MARGGNRFIFTPYRHGKTVTGLRSFWDLPRKSRHTMISFKRLALPIEQATDVYVSPNWIIVPVPDNQRTCCNCESDGRGRYHHHGEFIRRDGTISDRYYVVKP